MHRRNTGAAPLVTIADATLFGDVVRSGDGRQPLVQTRFGDALRLNDLPRGWTGKGTYKGLVTMETYFNALPETFPVYRGVPVPKGEAVRLTGTHWSLDRKIAENFARGEHEEASSWPDPAYDDAVLLTGGARLEDVVWPETLRLFLRFSLTSGLSLNKNYKKAEREVVLASPPQGLTATILPLSAD